MSHRRPLAVFLLCPFLASCGQTARSYPLEDYVHSIEKNANSFSILQLSDIHWNMTTRFDEAEAYLNNTFALASEMAGGKLDLVAITGDSLLVATKAMADRLYALIDSWGVPFTVSYGNHDLQGFWDEAWMNENVSSPKRKNSLFVNLNDTLYGSSNSVVNWTKDGKALWQIYAIDTNHYREKNAVKYGYDCVHPDQIAWFEGQADLSKGEAAEYNPSIVFGHIPVREIKEAYELGKDELHEKEATGMPVGGDGAYVGGFQKEGMAPSDVDDNFFEAMESHGVRGYFFGHDHSNDSVFRYKEVVLGYAVKANTELYYTSVDCQNTHLTMTGGALYTLHEDKTFDIEHFFVDYENWSHVAGWKREGL